MTRDDFQRLVSAWLDAPRDPALRAALARALRSDPALRAEFCAWQRMDALLRSLPAPQPLKRSSVLPPQAITAGMTSVPVRGPGAPDASRS